MISKLTKKTRTGRFSWRSVSLIVVVAVLGLIATGMPQQLAARIMEQEFTQIVGFRIGNDQEGQVFDDSAWESLTGGALRVELIHATSGDDSFIQVTPGFSTVTNLVLAGPITIGTGLDAEILRNGPGKFSVDLDGLPGSSQNIESISIDALEIPPREITTGSDLQFRVFAPGEPIYGEIELLVRRHNSSGELLEWWTEFAQGQNIRRDIELFALDREGQVARSWTFFNAFPVSYSPIGNTFSGTGNVATESITLRYERVEFSTGPRDRNGIGHQINEIIEGQNATSTLSVTEILAAGDDGRTLNYNDAFPTRYVFPQYSASENDNVTEEVHFKATTLTIQ